MAVLGRGGVGKGLTPPAWKHAHPQVGRYPIQGTVPGRWFQGWQRLVFLGRCDLGAYVVHYVTRV